jgi:hypothetical protein
MNQEISFSELIWQNLGSPQGKFELYECDSFCCTCGIKINLGARKNDFIGIAFSRQSEFTRFSEFACAACAYMYSFPKENHRNLIAFNKEIHFPMISHDSATEERKNWYEVLKKVLNEKPKLITGIITTDPKPRLWCMLELVTYDNFGLYIHNPDYNISEFFYFDLSKCLDYAELIIQCLNLGFSKQACFTSLLSDLKKANKDLKKALELESKLKSIRNTKEFIPALMISGLKKEAKETNKEIKQDGLF